MEVNVVLTESFEKWLKTLGYAESTVHGSVRYVSDFFFYLKSFEIINLEQIQPTVVTGYYNYLQTRPQKKQPGGLSQNYIVNNINAIKRFSKYIQVTGKGNLEISLQTPVNKDTHKIILNQEEIKSLYKACGNDYLGMRDQAILSIYYGCGLRRTEGINLDVKDVMLKEKLVFVRSGKGYKERYVPMTKAVREDLENYIYQGRQYISNFKKDIYPEALFLSMRVKRMSGNQVINRIQYLAKTAGINKLVGVHTLRHSIATHLLHAGMTLEEVSQFLGHSSLESTQIYTHLTNE